jgi:nicotinamidase-related amidase
MINPFTFEGAEKMLPDAIAAAERIAALKGRMKKARLPTIYVNDNFGKWRSDFRKLVAHCLGSSCRGKSITRMLCPEENDYFVLKPKHSGFYGTPLELLLEFLGVRRVILTGIAGNSCVLYTASDARMRGFKLTVPQDCVASMRSEENAAALEHMKKMLDADTPRSEELKISGASRRLPARRSKS